MTDVLDTISIKHIPLDPLKAIVSFLDWTCDLDNFNYVSKILTLSTNEKQQVLEYWKSKTIFETTTRYNGKMYFANRKLHNYDGPAIEWNNGDKEWSVNGKLHRTDGPAKEYANGTKKWYLYDLLHRLDGPAVEHPSGYIEYWQNDKLHRIDGPARMNEHGHKEWWIYGHRLSRRNFKKNQVNCKK